MIVWPEYRFAWLAMAGTASNAVSAALREAGATRIGMHHDIPPDNMSKLQQLGYDDTWTVATTTRKVVDWFSSMWRKGIWDAANQEAVTLDWIHEFEKDKTYFPEDGSGPFWKYVPWSNVVWRYESLQTDINNTFSKLGIPSISLRPINCSSRAIVSWESSALQYVQTNYCRVNQIPRSRPKLELVY